jgi:hypothetical protein
MDNRAQTWIHDGGEPNARMWRASMRHDGVLVVQALDDSGGVSDEVELARRGPYAFVTLKHAVTKLPSFLSWLNPVYELRQRAQMFGIAVPTDPILVHSTRMELMVELKYLPANTIQQQPGNASGAAHFFGIDVVWCKALDGFATVL